MGILKLGVYTNGHPNFEVLFGVGKSFANMCFHDKALTFTKFSEDESRKIYENVFKMLKLHSIVGVLFCSWLFIRSTILVGSYSLVDTIFRSL